MTRLRRGQSTGGLVPFLRNAVPVLFAGRAERLLKLRACKLSQQPLQKVVTSSTHIGMKTVLPTCYE